MNKESFKIRGTSHLALLTTSVVETSSRRLRELTNMKS